MKAIVDFLIEYYIWILVVLVILLITVIGFLADSMKKKKMRKNAEAAENSSGNEGVNNFNQVPSGDGFNNNMNASINNLNAGAGYNNLNNDYNGMMQNQSYPQGGQGGFTNPMPSADNNINGVNGTMPVNNVNQGFDLGSQNLNSFGNNMNVNPQMNSGLGNSLVSPMPEVVGNPNVNGMVNEVPAVNSFGNVNNDNVNANPVGGVTEAREEFFMPTSSQTPKIEPREVVVPTPVQSTPLMPSAGVDNMNGFQNPVASVNMPNVMGESPLVNPVNQGMGTVSGNVMGVPVGGMTMNAAPLPVEVPSNNVNVVNPMPVMENVNPTIPSPSSQVNNNLAQNFGPGFVNGQYGNNGMVSNPEPLANPVNNLGGMNIVNNGNPQMMNGQINNNNQQF